MKPYNNPDPNAATTAKTCNRCKQEKFLTEFGFKNKAIGVYRPYCRDCRNVMLKKEYTRRKEREYQKLLIAQGAEPTNAVPNSEYRCPTCHP